MILFGCEINFKIEGSKDIQLIKCYTTRPDTLFGLSFIALSVDHPISKYYLKNDEFIKEVGGQTNPNKNIDVERFVFFCVKGQKTKR